MHRTYSMRPTRPPTASQIQNPAPPPASTKSGRLFVKGNIAHAFRRSTAGAFAPDLAKKLAQLVKMEKNVMRSMEQVGKERRDVAYQLSMWGENCDPDVSDVTDKLGVLIYEIGVLEDQYIDRYDQYRMTLKSIRDIESSVQPCRDRKQKIIDQLAHLKFKDPKSPKIVTLEQELVRSEAESLVAEAQLSNITREKLKTAFTYQFDALREHCEKMAIIAGYGKHLLNLVDDEPVTPGETRAPYEGQETSRAIIQDCEDALSNWVSQNAAVRSQLSRRSQHLSQRQQRAKGSAGGRDHDSAIGSWIPASEHLDLREEDDMDVDEDGDEERGRRGEEEEDEEEAEDDDFLPAEGEEGPDREQRERYGRAPSQQRYQQHQQQHQYHRQSHPGPATTSQSHSIRPSRSHLSHSHKAARLATGSGGGSGNRDFYPDENYSRHHSHNHHPRRHSSTGLNRDGRQPSADRARQLRTSESASGASSMTADSKGTATTVTLVPTVKGGSGSGQRMPLREVA